MIFLGAQLAAAQNLFAPKQSYAVPNTTKPAFADFNGDGLLDMIALSVVEVNGFAFGNLYFFPGQTSNNNLFGAPVIRNSAVDITTSVSAPGALYAADFDKDGKQDLMYATFSGARFLKGNGDGTFVNNGFTVGSAMSTSLTIKDFDGDGNLDLFAWNSGFIRYGNGTGAFPRIANVFPLCTATGDPLRITRGLAFGDLNRDGREDVAADCSGANGAMVSYKNSDGTFGTPVVAANFTGRVSINDFNGDGLNDLLVMRDSQAAARYGAQDGTLLPETSVTIPPSIPGSVTGGYVGVASGDLNFDGIQDLVGLSATADTFNIMLGSSPGLFTLQSSTPMGTGFAGQELRFAIELVDVNGDGGRDVYTWDRVLNEVVIYLTNTPSVFLSSNVNPIAPGMTVTLSAVVASPSTGVVYSNGGFVTFFRNFGALGAPVALVNGQAQLPVSSLPVGIHYLTAKYQRTANGPVSSSNLVTVVVTPNACGLTANVQPGMVVNAGGFRFDRNTNQFVQDVDLTNRSTVPIAGPIAVMVSGLSPNATLATPHAQSVCNEPGAPVVDAGICPTGVLAVNQTVRVTLRFNNPSRTAIRYTPTMLAGLGRF
jgi:hypothetical protein